MMPNLNPFSNSKTIPYHRISREFSENVSDHGQSDTFSTPIAEEPYPDENVYVAAKALHRPRRIGLRHTCSYIFVAVLSVLIGLVVGEMFRVEYEVDGYVAPFGHSNRVVKDVVWYRNDTFAQEPSNVTENAWNQLMPTGRGFVKHPILTKGELKSVSVFHELHCLHMIRTAYFTADYLHRRLQHQTQPQNQKPLPSSPDDHSHLAAFTPNPYIEKTLAHPSLHGLAHGHVKHCFDYLRQALMCAADSNLEDTETEDGRDGAPGWGTKRLCRNYDRIRKWSIKWRTGEGQGVE